MKNNNKNNGIYHKNNGVIELAEILGNYSGKWVVLSKDNKVLKSGDTLDDIREFSDEGDIMLVPNLNYTYTPHFTS